jgi:type II secretory pathway component PulF
MAKSPDQVSKPVEFKHEAESLEVARSLMDLSAANLALPDGLRAAAIEADSTWLSDHLMTLADRIESGMLLPDSLRSTRKRMPDFVNGLVIAGIQSGNLDRVLLELISEYQRSRAMWRRIKLAMAYPVFLFVLSLGVCCFTSIVVSSGLRDAHDFIESSGFTSDAPSRELEHWEWFANHGIYVSLLFFTGMTIALVLLRLFAGQAFVSRVLVTVPAFGKLVLWEGYAEFCRFLGLLLRLQVPLPESLRLVSLGMRNQDVAIVSAILAERVQQGMSLAHSMERVDGIPAAVMTVTDWGEKTNQLTESLEALHDMLDGWVRLRADMLMRVLPPLFYLAAASFLIVAFSTILIPVAVFLRAIGGLN